MGQVRRPAMPYIQKVLGIGSAIKCETRAPMRISAVLKMFSANHSALTISFSFSCWSLKMHSWIIGSMSPPRKVCRGKFLLRR